jgi:hypothetical protein
VFLSLFVRGGFSKCEYCEERAAIRSFPCTGARHGPPDLQSDADAGVAAEPPRGMTATGGSMILRMIGAEATFTDEDGMLWTVTEREGHGVPGSRGIRCLIFDSPEAARRVWNYPAGWRDLLPPSLIALSWSQ